MDNNNNNKEDTPKDKSDSSKIGTASPNLANSGQISDEDRWMPEEKTPLLADGQEHSQSLQELIWNQRVPVRIELASEDIALDCESAPLPLFSMLHRARYVGFYYEKIHSFFENYCPVPLGAHNLWLECAGQALPWNIPLGAALDATGVLIEQESLEQLDEKSATQDQESLAQDQQVQQEQSSVTSEQFQPVILIAHYRNCPPNILPLSKNKYFQEVVLQFNFAIKQASIIRYGAACGARNFINEMNADDRDQLLQSYLSAEYRTFQRLSNEKIWRQRPEKIVTPVRIHVQGERARVQLKAEIDQEGKTLGQFLQQTFPDLLVQKNLFSEGQGALEPAAQYKKLRVLSHSVNLDLNTPLILIHTELLSCDGFAYFALRFS